jgi:fucose permease
MSRSAFAPRGAEIEVGMTGSWSVAVVTCTAAFVFGMLVALLGSVKLKLAERLHIGEGRIGGLLGALSLALIPMMLVSGLLIDALGVRFVLIVGALLAAVAVFGLTLRRSYAAALACVLVLGAGSACLSTASVVLMPLAFFGQHGLPASVNLGYVFVALGALMMPTLADLLLRTLGFHKTLSLLALVCLIPAVSALIFWPSDLSAPAEKTDLWGVLGSMPILLAGVAFLFYAPLEFAVSTWGSTYLTVEQGYSEGRAAWIMSFFWLAFLVGRVLVTLLFHSGRLEPERAPWAIFILAVAAAAMMGNLAGSGKPRSAAWGLIALGLALGPIFPTLVAVALRAAPNGHGTAYGAMFAVGSLGSAALAPLLGLLARGKSVMRALRLLAPLALLLVVAALALIVVPE